MTGGSRNANDGTIGTEAKAAVGLRREPWTPDTLSFAMERAALVCIYVSKGSHRVQAGPRSVLARAPYTTAAAAGKNGWRKWSATPDIALSVKDSSRAVEARQRGKQ